MEWEFPKHWLTDEKVFIEWCWRLERVEWLGALAFVFFDVVVCTQFVLNTIDTNRDFRHVVQIGAIMGNENVVLIIECIHDGRWTSETFEAGHDRGKVSFEFNFFVADLE